MQGDRFAVRMRDHRVVRDTQTLADLVEIWCAGQHGDRERRPLVSPTVDLGVYRRPPLLCEDCAAHMLYGEHRRALCPKDPKPFCAHCDIHCFRRDEAAWQRQVMRYSGPRSMWRGHFLDGLRHLFDELRHRLRALARVQPR